MTDEIKSAEAALTDVKAEITKLEAEEQKATNWIAIHHVIIYVALAFVVGLIGGHFLH